MSAFGGDLRDRIRPKADLPAPDDAFIVAFARLLLTRLPQHIAFALGEGMDAFSNAALAASLLGVLVLTGAASARFRVTWVWIFAAIIVVGLHAIAVRSSGQLLPSWGALDENWNVSGKFYAIVASVITVLALRIDPRALGLTWRWDRQAMIAWAFLAAVTLILIGLAFAAPDRPSDWGERLYQATLPGLDEELFYRGLLLAILLKAFASVPNPLASLVPAVITTLAFVGAHALVIEEGAFTLRLTGIASPLIAGTLLVWLRLQTGGLLAPILLHNTINSVFRWL